MIDRARSDRDADAAGSAVMTIARPDARRDPAPDVTGRHPERLPSLLALRPRLASELMRGAAPSTDGEARAVELGADARGARHVSSVERLSVSYSYGNASPIGPRSLIREVSPRSSVQSTTHLRFGRRYIS